jgi:outer membrane lipoprotein-sorting protein
MKMRKKPLFVLTTVLAVAVVGYFIIPSLSSAAEFSADMIHKTGEQTVKGKVYVKENKIRQEAVQDGEKGVVIIRMDKGLVWNLMPEEKMYMEMPSMGDVANDPEYEKKLEEMAEKKYLGKEKVAGYACKKYKYIYRDKSMGTLTQWFSEKLNYPIKTELSGQQGGVEMLIEYTNIKEQKLPDSLFEIPSGYTKMSIPGMPK